MNILNSKGISLSFENKILRRDIKDICFFLEKWNGGKSKCEQRYYIDIILNVSNIQY